jgi:magnesium transporter
LSSAVGTQTESIYIRDSKAVGWAHFFRYLHKEIFLGLIFGAVFALITALIVMLWFKSSELTLAVSLSVFGATASAPLIALIVSKLLQVERTDPAVGAGPIATVVQDAISVLIYGLIATAILL